MSKNTVCSAFWIHTNLRSGNKVFPCCRYKQSIMDFDGDLNSVLLSDAYDTLRRDSITGVHNPNCQKCYYEESLGKKSLREEFNEKYDQFEDPQLKFLQIGFDNMCNLACDGCGPEFSSTWALLIEPHHPSKIAVVSTREINCVPNSIEKILFLGGEPLMNNRHRRFLSGLNDLSKVEVVYNTNGSFLLDNETVSLLKKCKRVEFIVSVDGYKDLNAKVRKNSQWSDVLKFIDQIKTHEFDLLIHTTLHLNNWFGLQDLQAFIKSIDAGWRINVLTHPTRLDIVNLPEHDKETLLNDLGTLDISTDFIKRHLYTN